MNDPIEVAYLAGFFDGEGCIAMHARRHIPYLQVVQTNDREPLEAMLPYLTVKRDQARIALQHKRYPKGKNRLSVEDREARRDIAEQLRVLKHSNINKYESMKGASG